MKFIPWSRRSRPIQIISCAFCSRASRAPKWTAPSSISLESSGIWLEGKSLATLETSRSVSPKSEASWGQEPVEFLAKLGVLLERDLQGLLRLGGFLDDRVEVFLRLDPLDLDLRPGRLHQPPGLIVRLEVILALGQLDRHLSEQFIFIYRLFQLAESYRPVLAKATLRLARPGLGDPQCLASQPHIPAEPLGTRLGFGLADHFGKAFKSRRHQLTLRPY